MMPRVSVIIPTFNYAQYIVEAVDSILQQDYPADRIEIIVLDDGSTDNTKDVLEGLIRNKKIQYHYQQNEGKASATYKAIQLSSGKYIFNLDADDYFLQNKIKRTVEVFEADESIVHVASPAEIIEENNAKGEEALPREIVEKKTGGLQLLHYFYDNNILYGGGSTFSARASVLKQICIPAEVDMYIDEFLLLTVLPHGKTFFLKEPLSVWRIHNINYSGQSQTVNEQRAKGSRLLKASAAVLDYLQRHNFDKRLVKIYTLKNVNRQIAYKETIKTKSLTDIFKYAKNVIFNIQPGWKLVKRYQVLNRLLPLSLYLFLKKIAR